MDRIEEIAKDGKFIKIEDQLLVLIRRQLKTEFMLEEKFRDLCKEMSNFVKESEDMVQEFKRLSGNDCGRKDIVHLLRQLFNGNVVVDLDVGGEAWHHVCSHAMFDVSLSIPVATCLSQTVSMFAIILTL
ncbi:hypothetical protein Tco_1174175 [Tanacetum coccineum]